MHEEMFRLYLDLNRSEHKMKLILEDNHGGIGKVLFFTGNTMFQNDACRQHHRQHHRQYHRQHYRQEHRCSVGKIIYSENSETFVQYF